MTPRASQTFPSAVAAIVLPAHSKMKRLILGVQWQTPGRHHFGLERSEGGGPQNFSSLGETFVPRKAAGFTLLELLAVIAIIAILAAVLLPALGRSKTSARQIRCFSNIHQLALAAQMYWDDNGGNCFSYGGVVTNGGQLYWFGWIAAASQGEGKRAFDPSQGALYPYLQGRGVETCPAFNYNAPEVKLKATGSSYGYGYNRFLSGKPTQLPVKITNVANLSGIVLFGDAAQVNDFQPPASKTHPMLEEFYYLNSTEATGHFRHAQKGAVVFCDGHAGAERFAPGSVDQRLPREFVARYRSEILEVP